MVKSAPTKSEEEVKNYAVKPLGPGGFVFDRAKKICSDFLV